MRRSARRRHGYSVLVRTRSTSMFPIASSAAVLSLVPPMSIGSVTSRRSGFAYDGSGRVGSVFWSRDRSLNAMTVFRGAGAVRMIRCERSRSYPVRPTRSDSTMCPEPPADDGPVLVETLAIGVCGTDVEIVRGDYGAPPPGADRLILGHESLGRVLDAPSGCGLTTGDLVVGIVRRPDPVPCPNCAVGEWDMCRNGRYTERGINGRNGYASDRYRIRPELRGQGRSRTRSRRRAGGARERRRQGMGTHRPHRQPRALATVPGHDHWRGPNRIARGVARTSARPGCRRCSIR